MSQNDSKVAFFWVKPALSIQSGVGKLFNSKNDESWSKHDSNISDGVIILIHPFKNHLIGKMVAIEGKRLGHFAKGSKKDSAEYH